jgi:hypothetical protein
MNFLVTNHIYPLPEPIRLSSELDICLDNPRTDDEISFIERLLTRAADSGEDYAPPLTSDEDIVTLEAALYSFRDSVEKVDPGLEQRFEHYSRERAVRFLATVFVVVRYHDEGATRELYEFHKQARARGELTFSIFEEDDPIEKARKTLQDYGYLLSLLANSEGDGYHGRGFIIADPEPTKIQSTSMWFSLIFTNMACADGSEAIVRRDPLNWVFFPHAKSQLIEQSRLLDEGFRKGLTEKLLYVGSLLRIAAEDAQNERIRLVVLASILELLVTHSPDYKRFNVEESISRQFRLKVGLLAYLNNKTRDIEAIGQRLKIIYEQRSNVAHGNFEAINRYMRSLSKTDGEEEYFDDLISDLYTYVRAVVEEYLKDKPFVDFLRKN